MNLNLSDLLASFPEDEKASGVLGSEEAREQLEAVFADLAYRPVPVHSLHRLWTIGELSAQIALAYTGLWARGLFADARRKERQTAETNLRVAMKMVHRLGYLRGAAVKLGQAFGSLPKLLPEQVVETLDLLHAQAPPMHFSLIREVVRSELGKDPSEVFAAFDKEPFAAASIGQVHRATLKSGEEAAVKIQYPGIGRAMQADLRNLMALIFPMRLTKGGQSIKAQCEAMREMLVQETDYVREAQNLREALGLFRPEDGVVVPRVFSEYSSPRVLTTEYVRGLSFQQFLASKPSQELRDAFGTKINRAWFRMFFANASYSDPHSGNYLFLPDGRLGLLDFGCIQRLTVEELRLMELFEPIMEGEGKVTLEEHLLNFGYSEADVASERYMAPLRRHHDWLLATVRQEGPFDFSNEEFFRWGIESLTEMVQKTYPSPPMYLYQYRSIFGLRVLCYRLKCRVDIGALRREEIKQRRT